MEKVRQKANTARGKNMFYPFLFTSFSQLTTNLVTKSVLAAILMQKFLPLISILL